jgi:DNA-binding response OmpR family regulator
MQREKIYIIGTDIKITKSINMRFLVEGFDSSTFIDVDEMLAQEKTPSADLVLVLTTATCENSVNTCIKLREKTDTVLIVMGEKMPDTEAIAILSVGADICVQNPISTSVLLAQIHSCFRRYKLESQSMNGSQSNNYIIDYTDLKIDVKSRSVIVNYNPVVLTAIEFDILALLASNPNQVFYTSQIFQNVWDAESILTGDYRTVTVHVSNLRKK